jgi:hypothetical protein
MEAAATVAAAAEAATSGAAPPDDGAADAAVAAADASVAAATGLSAARIAEVRAVIALFSSPDGIMPPGTLTLLVAVDPSIANVTVVPGSVTTDCGVLIVGASAGGSTLSPFQQVSAIAAMSAAAALVCCVLLACVVLLAARRCAGRKSRKVVDAPPPAAGTAGEATEVDDETEVEAFVHGALCVSYSGQCFSSEAWGTK